MRHRARIPAVTLPLALALPLAFACGDDGAGDIDAGVIDAPPLFDTPLPIDAHGEIDATPPDNTASLQFDGTDDLVRVPSGGSLGGYPGLTIELWVKPADTGGAGLVAKSAGAGDPEYRVLRRDDGDLEIAFRGDGETCVAITGAAALPTDTWTHVAATWGASPTGRPKLFVGGAQLSQSACATTDLGNALVDLVFGAVDEAGTVDRYFAGHIDEVRLWNIERTGPEIAATMNRRLFGGEPGLVGYWPFDEGSGNTAADATINNLDATLGDAAGPDAADPMWSTDVPF